MCGVCGRMSVSAVVWCEIMAVGDGCVEEGRGRGWVGGFDGLPISGNSVE